MYRRIVKPMLDIIISLIGIIALFIPMVIISLAIVIDDQGSIFFKQKRVGKKKNGKLTYFNMIKFRSMIMSAPRNIPTHQLDNPDRYLTRVGRQLRRYSLDELAQLYQVAFTPRMSLIGPRPALWNQNDLIAEREKYGANDIKPGITGLAQINGRDILNISAKAKYDGEYADALKKGGITAFKMDMHCFFTTIKYVLKKEGIVEGVQVE